ncbi:MAG: hypothetical protein KY433_08460 [Actinobacteria bacterium]|nr:hypothetical protein [Actinomycetota bacterium]
MSAFIDRSYRIAPDGRSVVCDAVVGEDENESLGEALAWRRDEIARQDLQGAGEVLELRALMTLDDLLGVERASGPEATVTLSREQAGLLCQISCAYVTERDTDSYQPPEERDRIARLRGLAGPLIDLCCEFSAAEDEAREHLVSA